MSIVEFVVNSTSPLFQAISDHSSFEMSMAMTAAVVGGSCLSALYHSERGKNLLRKASNLNLRSRLAVGMSRKFNAVRTAVSTVGGLRENRNFILQMIQKNGGMEALYFASENLRRDPEIALKAVEQDSRAMRFVSETLKRDSAFLLDAIGRNPAVFFLLPDQWLADSDFMWIAAQRIFP